MRTAKIYGLTLTTFWDRYTPEVKAKYPDQFNPED